MLLFLPQVEAGLQHSNSMGAWRQLLLLLLLADTRTVKQAALKQVRTSRTAALLPVLRG